MMAVASKHGFLALLLALAGLGIPCLAAERNPDEVADAWDRPAVLSRADAHSFMTSVALAGSRQIAVGERGLILLSGDRGVHWTQAPVPVSVTLTDVDFFDANTGYATGHSGVVLATTDGGAHWQVVLTGEQIARILLAEAEASGNDHALRAANYLVQDGPDKPLFDLLVLSAKHLIVVGAYGLALESNDGGATWSDWAQRLNNVMGLHLYGIRKQGQRWLVFGEQGLVQLSVDNGHSFSELETPYPGSFFTGEITAGGRLVLAGLKGNTLVSADDAGQHWQEMSNPVVATITSSLYQDGELLLVNQAGHILRETNGALLPVINKKLPPLNHLVRTQDGGLLAASVRGIISIESGDVQ